MQVRKTWSPDSLIEVSDLVRNLPNSLLLEDSTNNYMKIDSINSGGFGEVTKFLDTKTLNHIAGKLIKFSFKMVELSQQKKSHF
uniref:Protein kinase domain-containing protein n=1 Tax=Acrobeloides nanus TaxID=290746 RepID=A0A914EDF9_9BILA